MNFLNREQTHRTVTSANGHSHLPQTSSNVSTARRQVVELMRSIRYGRIENLAIVAGEPVLRPGQAIVQEIKFGSDDNSRSDLTTEEFILKRQIVELFEYLDSVGDGLIHTLEVKGGLPFKIEAERRI